MPRLTDIDLAAVVHNGSARSHGVRKISLREDEIKLCEVLIAADNAVRELARVCAEVKENALDLLFLLAAENLYVVIRLHDAHRLDENRLTRGGGVVNKTGHVVAALGLDRYNVPSVALSHDCVLQIFDVF